MNLCFPTQSGDIRIETPVAVEIGETFQEGTARYRIEEITPAADGRIHVRCRLVDGRHPFWWAPLADGADSVWLEGTFLARLLHQKRAFLISSRSL